MKKIATWLGIIVLVVGGGILTLRPNTAWRMYDAQLRPLAMTEAEAYCVGANLQPPIIASPQEGVAECLASSKKETEPSIANTIGWTCEGVAETWDMPVDVCVDAMEGYGLWPLLQGGFTMDWSEAWPRPEVIEETIIGVAPPRQSERDTESRG